MTVQNVNKKKLEKLEGLYTEQLILTWSNLAWENKEPLKTYLINKVEKMLEAVQYATTDAMTSSDIEKMVKFRKEHHIEV